MTAARISPAPNHGAAANRANAGTATLPTYRPWKNGVQSRAASAQRGDSPSSRNPPTATAADPISQPASTNGRGSAASTARIGSVGGG